MATKSQKKNAATASPEAFRSETHFWDWYSGPRLSVFRSNKHIYAQVIDDVTGTTIASASSQSEAIREARLMARKRPKWRLSSDRRLPVHARKRTLIPWSLTGTAISTTGESKLLLRPHAKVG